MSPITSAASASTLDPDTEVIAALGSKEGFANLAMAITAPGDVVLVPNPAYPIHAFGFMIAGAAIRHVPATSPEEYLSRAGHGHAPFGAVARRAGGELSLQSHRAGGRTSIFTKRSSSSRRSMRSGCSPISLMPTSISATRRRLRSCRWMAPRTSPSNSSRLSKTYAMPGWRMGFAAGNEKLIGALARIKSYLDYGAFTPIQVAAAAALNGPQDACR